MESFHAVEKYPFTDKSTGKLSIFEACGRFSNNIRHRFISENSGIFRQ
jgi:hypothetical protein